MFRSISLSRITSNVARSPIQLTKQGATKRAVGWGRFAKFEKGERVGKIRVLRKIGC